MSSSGLDILKKILSPGYLLLGNDQKDSLKSRHMVMTMVGKLISLMKN